ncbi:MAG TPA: ABC transporter ATP-binding protein [Steroidobacteraceae bacterium]|jgi:ABC-type bacteriocin/lantibiotic exporter with double-glycine peptidase domain
MMPMMVWRLLERRRKTQLLALQILSVLMALGTVTGIAAILPFFTALADPAAAGRSRIMAFLHRYLGLQAAGGAHLAVGLGLAFIALVALANLVNLAGTLLMNRFAFETGNSFAIELFESYLGRDYDFHLRTHSATLTARLLHETMRVTVGVLQSGLTLATNVLTVALIVGSMVLIDPVIAAIALGALGTTYVAIYLAARGRLLRNGLEESSHYAERTRIVAESLGAVKEILLWRAQPLFAARFAASCRSISRNALSTLAISQTPRNALELATVCALVGSALYLGGGRQGGRPWIAALSFMGLAVYRLLPALQQAFTALVRIRADRPALESIAADLQEARSRLHTARSAALDAAWRGRPRREILVDNVLFRYEPAAAAAIAGLTLRIPAGTMVGLVGDNGSGKTTLLDLVAGLLVAESGAVAVDGVRIDAASRAAWQSTIAYVPQRLFLLDATLDENIALGTPLGAGDRERLQSAVALARLDECAAVLAAGGSDRLGERGTRLSGGQRQRVAIARALYRDASVLIMDEATSELDEAAEQGIIDSLEALRAGRTIILTGHRLSSLKHCDVIFELERGRLARTLTYQALQASPGLRQRRGRGVRGAS